MGKATRSLSGASQKKYFRDLLRATDGLPADAAARLGDTLEREVAQVRVRLPIPARGDGALVAKRKPGSRRPADPAPNPSSAAATTHPATPETAPGTGATPFDPFAFSVVVAVTKEGRDGLMKRLKEIESLDDLTALAKAQHVAVPASAQSLEAIREAIAEGALQRIANRRAAAS